MVYHDDTYCDFSPWALLSLLSSSSFQSLTRPFLPRAEIGQRNVEIPISPLRIPNFCFFPSGMSDFRASKSEMKISFREFGTKIPIGILHFGFRDKRRTAFTWYNYQYVGTGINVHHVTYSWTMIPKRPTASIYCSKHLNYIFIKFKDCCMFTGVCQKGLNIQNG